MFETCKQNNCVWANRWVLVGPTDRPTLGQPLGIGWANRWANVGPTYIGPMLAQRMHVFIWNLRGMDFSEGDKMVSWYVRQLVLQKMAFPEGVASPKKGDYCIQIIYSFEFG